MTDWSMGAYANQDSYGDEPVPPQLPRIRVTNPDVEMPPPTAGDAYRMGGYAGMDQYKPAPDAFTRYDLQTQPPYEVDPLTGAVTNPTPQQQGKFGRIMTAIGGGLQSLAEFPMRYAQQKAIQDYGAPVPESMSQGDVEDLQMRRSADYAGADWAAGNALGMLGIGAPLAMLNVPQTGFVAGMFGGRAARTVDTAKLKQAQQMAKAGEKPDVILDTTGFEQRPDRKWRYEINDRDATVNMGELANAHRVDPYTWQTPGFSGRPGATLGDVLSHPELYNAYPQLERMPVYAMPARDAFGAAVETRGGYSPSQRAFYLREGLSPEEARGVLLHEAQHGIQSIEGFAAGGSPSERPVVQRADKHVADVTTQMENRVNEIREGMWDWITKNTPQGEVNAKTIKQWRAANPELAATADIYHGALENPGMMRKQARFDSYRQLIGEAEARNVPTRADLTPEQRFLLRPEVTEDVPRDQQWLKKQPKGVASVMEARDDGPGALFDPARTAEPERWAPARPGAGHNGGPPLPPDYPPPTGSMNPLDNVPVTFRGKQPKDFTPEEWQAFGQHYGAENMGPLSPLQTFKDIHGNEFRVPGGTEGKWTYYDLLHMKADPINPANVDRALHGELQRKLGRTMTPAEPSDAQVWNGLVFGMTSPNNPLLPNQITASRLRLRSPEMLDDLASMVPWKFGEDVPAETRKALNDQIARRYSLGAAPEGLGTRGTADYTRVAEMAKMFKENPAFFRKQPDESWMQAVERITSQLPGLSAKTGSFGTVWQDPAHAAISAVDRHMVKELDKRGGVFASPAERADWQDRALANWNKKYPEDAASSFTDMTTKRGADGYIGERLMNHLNQPIEPKFRIKGEINPNVPPHLAQAQWVREPDKITTVGRAYRKALEVNQKLAEQSGLNLFMSQWLEWDRIRNRFEPHENMFPGLSKTPAMSVEQMREVADQHKLSGHKTYTKTDEGSLPPTRPLPKGTPSSMGYLGMGGVAALPPAAELLRQYQEDAR